MPRVFYDQSAGDDMQMSTFTLVAYWISRSQQAFHARDPFRLERELSCLSFLALPRADRKEREEIIAGLDSLRTHIYSASFDKDSPVAVSRALDQCEDLLRRMLDLLKDVLYRVKTDLRSLSAE